MSYDDNGKTIAEIKANPLNIIDKETEEEFGKSLFKVTFFVEDTTLDIAESLVQDLFQERKFDNPNSFRIEEASNENRIEEEIKRHEQLEIYCTEAGDPQEARKHKNYREALTLALSLLGE